MFDCEQCHDECGNGIARVCLREQAHDDLAAAYYYNVWRVWEEKGIPPEDCGSSEQWNVYAEAFDVFLQTDLQLQANNEKEDVRRLSLQTRQARMKQKARGIR